MMAEIMLRLLNQSLFLSPTLKREEQNRTRQLNVTIFTNTMNGWDTRNFAVACLIIMKWVPYSIHMRLSFRIRTIRSEHTDKLALNRQDFRNTRSMISTSPITHTGTTLGNEPTRNHWQNAPKYMNPKVIGRISSKTAHVMVEWNQSDIAWRATQHFNPTLYQGFSSSSRPRSNASTP